MPKLRAGVADSPGDGQHLHGIHLEYQLGLDRALVDLGFQMSAELLQLLSIQHRRGMGVSRLREIVQKPPAAFPKNV